MFPWEILLLGLVWTHTKTGTDHTQIEHLRMSKTGGKTKQFTQRYRKINLKTFYYLL